MTKEITLNIGERMAATKIINEFKGNISTLAVLLDDVKKLTVTAEEWVEDGLVKTPTDVEIAALPPEEKKKASQTWAWNNKVEKVIVFADDTFSYIKDAIEAKSTNKEITFANKELVTLLGKLK